MLVNASTIFVQVTQARSKLKVAVNTFDCRSLHEFLWVPSDAVFLLAVEKPYTTLGLNVLRPDEMESKTTARVVSELSETRPKYIARSAWEGGYSAPCVISPPGDCLAGSAGTWILQQAFGCGEKQF